MATGEADRALGAVRTALDLAERGRLRLEEGAALRVLGQTYAAMGRPDDAEAAFGRSLRVLEEIQSRPELAQTLLAHGRFRMGDDPAAGGRLIRRVLALFEEMEATGWIEEARAALP